MFFILRQYFAKWKNIIPLIILFSVGLHPKTQMELSPPTLYTSMIWTGVETLHQPVIKWTPDRPTTRYYSMTIVDGNSWFSHNNTKVCLSNRLSILLCFKNHVYNICRCLIWTARPVTNSGWQPTPRLARVPPHAKWRHPQPSEFQPRSPVSTTSSQQSPSKRSDYPVWQVSWIFLHDFHANWEW